MEGYEGYLVLINMQLSQVRIEEQLIGHHINGRLASSFVAHVPLRIDEAPETRTCNIQTQTGEVSEEERERKRESERECVQV